MHYKWRSQRIHNSEVNVDLLTNQIMLSKGQANYLKINRLVTAPTHTHQHTVNNLISRRRFFKRRKMKNRTWHVFFSNPLMIDEEEKLNWQIGQATLETQTGWGHRWEGKMKGQLKRKCYKEWEAGGRLDCWWLTDVLVRERLKPSQEAT